MEWGNRAAIEQAGAIDPLINLLRLNHSPGVNVAPHPPPVSSPHYAAGKCVISAAVRNNNIFFIYAFDRPLHSPVLSSQDVR